MSLESPKPTRAEAAEGKIVARMLEAISNVEEPPPPPRLRLRLPKTTSGVESERFLNTVLRGRPPATFEVARRKLGELLATGSAGYAPGLRRIAVLLAGTPQKNRSMALRTALDKDPEVRAELEAWISKDTR